MVTQNTVLLHLGTHSSLAAMGLGQDKVCVEGERGGGSEEEKIGGMGEKSKTVRLREKERG